MIVPLLIIATSLLTFAQDITLSWENSPSFGVKGYKVYFKKGNTDFSSQPARASEGLSPIDTGRSLTASLSGLSDNDIYYFSVTAYDSHDESDFSNIVSNSWMPPLIAPRNMAYSVPLPVMFQWGADAENQYDYTLYYGPHKDELLRAEAIVASRQEKEGPYNLTVTGFIIFLLFLMLLTTLQGKQAFISANIRGTKYQLAAILMVITLVSCGGSGSSGTEMTSVHMGSDTHFQTFDLQPATTYFWKVVATTPSAPSRTVYHSDIYSFTTE